MNFTTWHLRGLVDSCMTPDYEEIAARILDGLEGIDFSQQAADGFVEDLVESLEELGNPLFYPTSMIVDVLQKKIPVLIDKHLKKV